MNKTVRLFFIFLVLLISYIFANNYKNEKQKQFNECLALYGSEKQYDEAATCFEGMYQKYKQPIFKYNEGNAYFLNNDFQKAKECYEFYLNNEKNNKEIIQSAKDTIAKIDAQQNIKKQISKAKDLNIDNYYADLSDTAIWKNPTDLKVYIDLSQPNSLILKEGFEKWNDTFKGIIHFNFVKSKENADITCDFRDEIPENPMSIGITNTQQITYSDNPNVKYLKKADIHILYKNPITYENFSNRKILATTMHEIGHALGITAHSPNPKDIMYIDDSSFDHVSCNLSYRDINTVRILYGKLFKN